MITQSKPPPYTLFEVFTLIIIAEVLSISLFNALTQDEAPEEPPQAADSTRKAPPDPSEAQVESLLP